MKFFFNGGGYNQLVHTLRLRGHEVIQGAAPWINYLANKESCKVYNKRILKDAIKKYKPDIYICSKGFKQGNIIYPETNDWIHKRVKLSIYWSQDDPYFIPKFMERNMYVGYDIALSCSSEKFETYRKVGITPYLFWPAWDELARVRKLTKEEDKIDFIFVGTPYACTDIPRKDILLWVIKQGWKTEIYGSPAWISNTSIKSQGKVFIQGDSRLKSYYKGMFNDWTQLHNLFGKARITFSSHVNKARMYMNDRVPIVMGHGACLIMDKNPGMDKVFKHNKEIVFYEDFNTFKHRANYYLKHIKMRQNIEKNSRLAILKNHTYESRANQLLNIIKKHL